MGIGWSTLKLFWVGMALAGGPDAAQSLAGDYAGWGYELEGGDFPLRLHLTVKDDRLAGSLDSPAQKAYGLAVSDVTFQEGCLRFQRRNQQGNLWTYELQPHGRDLRGEASIDGKRYAIVEFHRSESPLPPARPASVRELTGMYRSSAGDSVSIHSWFWGEFRLSDFSTGREATLFEVTPLEYFFGPALYVPSPEVARVVFERASDGKPARCRIRPANGPERVLDRVASAEEEVRFENGPVKLQGTLIKPAAEGRFPAIVVMGGSGWRTREDTRQDAARFAALGMAALIYDQRGYGKSTGEPVCSFEETAADARAAVTVLQGRSDILADKVGLSGRSRGGWFAPLAAAGSREASFVVIFVPPAISPARQETTRRLNEFRASGASEADLEEARGYLGLLFRATESDADWERYTAARPHIAQKGWLPHLDEVGSRDSEDYAWSRLNMGYDPIPALEKVTCPLLALFGERDHNVTPSENIPPMEAALKRAGNKSFRLEIIPDADHGLRLPPFGQGDARSALHRTVGVAPQVWPTMQRWLSDRGVVPPR